MRIKSYFAKSVDEAMVQARAELGNDALLLNTRKNEGGKPENYEVVFGTAEGVGPLPLPEIKLPQSVNVAPAHEKQTERKSAQAEGQVERQAERQVERQVERH